MKNALVGVLNMTMNAKPTSAFFILPSFTPVSTMDVTLHADIINNNFNKVPMVFTVSIHPSYQACSYQRTSAAFSKHMVQTHTAFSIFGHQLPENNHEIKLIVSLHIRVIHPQSKLHRVK